MCIFCETYNKNVNIIHENDSFFSIYDRYPVSNGHVLIISKRHVTDYFELDINEKYMLDREIVFMKDLLDKLYVPDGYNIGINQGMAAGQTIFHLHIHLIPRYKNDVEDPKGGVRGVIPIKQKY